MAADAMTDLRHTQGAVAIARDVVRVAGPDAIAYLQGQVSQDVGGLAVGATAWTFVLQPAGKVDAWGRLTRTADDEVLIDLDGGHGEAVAARLRRFLLRTKADVDLLAWRAVAVRGPGADEIGAGAGGAELAVPAGWPGVEGVDLLGPDVTLPAGVPPAEIPAFESLRIRAGVPALGRELTDATIPAEVGQGVIERSVSFTKGCFTGQELVARIESRGSNVPRRLRGLIAPGDEPPAIGAVVVVDNAEVGTVTSVAPGPRGGSVALASVGRAVTPPAEASVAGEAGPVPVTVVELPMAD